MEDGGTSFGGRGEVVVVNQFVFQAAREAPDKSVVVAVALRAMKGESRVESVVGGKAALANWLPRPEGPMGNHFVVRRVGCGRCGGGSAYSPNAIDIRRASKIQSHHRNVKCLDSTPIPDHYGYDHREK